MTQLRPWQTECVDEALQVFEYRTHFLCHATPGAGKTIMVASVAKTLLERKKIDFVLCFSPSRAVSQSVESTFGQFLGRTFNGQIGAAGGSYTYQSMRTLPKELWRVLSEHNVLVILDEIHHCAGHRWDDLIIGNSWGRTILDRIQGKATFTIALSGTPWRTDDHPIVLSRYMQPDGKLHCDYEYGLQRAVSEGVCREPRIVLTDNREISLRSSELGFKNFTSIQETIKQGHVSYPEFLFRDEVIDHLISEASIKLSDIRKQRPSAAGLVVAATVAHAEQVARRLSALGEKPVLVTYNTPDANEVISDFKHSSDSWIISVGMISEGTDIPRLQVCCHLSRIRTELHFRQVLGRVLRCQAGEPADLGGWLYVLAEPNLTEFAYRVGDDLPGQRVVSFSPKFSKLDLKETNGAGALLPDNIPSIPNDPGIDLSGSWVGAAQGFEGRNAADLRLSNQYWSEVLSLFDKTLT
ncbi:DEAD/DEAH box helicase [Marinobacter sp. AN1]|uniref:DEAD/DEAH box helicase n=1 Tax=Marinobacter sp. AN1 TaxID=2886046 RepID=UPI00222E092F|nr:DEAD/DEAH box helicase family protein [Marinobacter sp. AN1]UZD65703.1 DEAD/DEAH box helicase family protein [Marinobacter sp. AN1]